MEDKSEFEMEGKEQGKFNMAIDTLKRLSMILDEIRKVTSDLELPSNFIQVKKISLIKQFFIQSCPLLEEEFRKEKQQYVINLKPKIIPVYDNKPYSNQKRVGTAYAYDLALDIELDTLLIDIQMNLQEKGVFMPPKEEEGLF